MEQLHLDEQEDAEADDRIKLLAYHAVRVPAIREVLERAIDDLSGMKETPETFNNALGYYPTVEHVNWPPRVTVANSGGCASCWYVLLGAAVVTAAGVWAMVRRIHDRRCASR